MLVNKPKCVCLIMYIETAGDILCDGCQHPLGWRLGPTPAHTQWVPFAHEC